MTPGDSSGHKNIMVLLTESIETINALLSLYQNHEFYENKKKIEAILFKV
jgi:hypothetical protein